MLISFGGGAGRGGVEESNQGVALPPKVRRGARNGDFSIF